MSWRGVSGGIAAAKLKHDVIMTPNSHLYFDYYQGDPKHEPVAIGGYLPMEKVYSYEPIPTELDENERKHILGAQGNVWTEYISNQYYLMYMAVPRMCALSEVVWTPVENRDYEKFTYRMTAHYKRLDGMKVMYRIPPPVSNDDNVIFLREYELELHNSMDGASIHYTNDGSWPGKNSPLYTEPLSFDNDALIKAITIMPSGLGSVPIEIKLDKQSPQPGLDLNNPIQGISYAIYEASFKNTKEMEGLEANFRDEISSFTLPDPDRKGSYGMKMACHLKVEKSGVYRFFVRSDDGTVLTIEGNVVVNNDGWHAPIEKSGAMALGEGWHRLDLDFIQAGGAQFLEVLWSGPDFEKQEIPNENLASMMTMLPMMPKR